MPKSRPAPARRRPAARRAALRAVTVRQPWAWAIAHGHKKIENRTWAPDLQPGELLAIHAADQAPTRSDLELLARVLGRPVPPPAELPRGGVVAVVRYLRTVDSSASPCFAGPLGWVLVDPVVVDPPVPCPGRQRVWSLPRDVAEQVLARIGRP